METKHIHTICKWILAEEAEAPWGVRRLALELLLEKHIPQNIEYLTHREYSEISEAISHGKKIYAIKLYRTFTGKNLKEAKDDIVAHFKLPSP